MNFLLRFHPGVLFFLLVFPTFFWSFSVSGICFFLLWTGVYIGWIYSIGKTMNALMPDKIRPNIKYFNFYCTGSVTMLFIMVALTYFNSTLYKLEDPIRIGITVALTLFYFFLFFSMWMFAARMLESVTEGRLVYRSDSIRAFFYFWMFPIGVWYIQPAVKRVLDKYRSHPAVNP